MPGWYRRLLFYVALIAASAYAFWNVYWIIQWRVPPSILTALTGLPCPTTGGTRAVCALLVGDWQTSLKYNALAVPILGLLTASVACLGYQWVRAKRLALPPYVVWLWGALLLTAWLVKLLGDRAYW